MNKRGFTLIELLAVITIIAMLMMIATPSVINLIEKNKVDACNSIISSIESAASRYVSDYKYDSSVVVGNEFDIKIETLVNKKYLSREIKNPLISNDSTDYSNDVVKVKYDSVSKLFSFKYEGNLSCVVS